MEMIHADGELRRQLGVIFSWAGTWPVMDGWMDGWSWTYQPNQQSSSSVFLSQRISEQYFQPQ
jgi:hypothetical protein